MYSEVTIIGYLGDDPSLRYTPSGDPVTSFSVASNRSWPGAGGEKETEVTWFRISVWGKQAESCNQFLAKGRQVFIKGRLSPDRETGGPRIWTDNHGEARASYEVRALQVQFLGGGGGNKPPDDDDPRGYSSNYSEAEPVSEDEIPF